MVDIMTQKPPLFKTSAYKHQTDEITSRYNSPYWGIFWEMGTGKTKVVIDQAALLFLEGQIDSLLIVAPKGVYLNWTNIEIPKHMSDRVDYFTAHYSAQMRQCERNDFGKVMGYPQPGILDILAMNVESFSTDKGYLIASCFMRKHRGTMMVIDESTCIKNISAARTKAIVKLRPMAKFRRILSGTPVTQSPLDLYSQFEFLGDSLLGFDSFFQFKCYHAIIVNIRLGTRSFPKITGYRNLDELKKRMMRYSSRVVKTDCLDLPEKIFETVCVEMTPEQRRIYEEIRDMALSQLDAESESKGFVSVTSALTALTKLQQVTCGHVRNDLGVDVDIPNNRISAMMENIEICGAEKIVIWCNFRRDVELVRIALTAEYGEESVRLYQGGSSNDDRTESIRQFTQGDTARFLICTSAGSRGLTLVVANHNILYSVGYNLEIFLQLQDRTHRIGQDKNVTYVMLQCPGTVDEKVIKALQAKKNISDGLLSNWKQLFIED